MVMPKDWVKEWPKNFVTIRKANDNDMTRGFVETMAVFGEINLTPAELIINLHERISRSIQTYVAVLKPLRPDSTEEVIGTISCFMELKFIHAVDGNGGEVCHIEDVAVRKIRQLKGIGRLLMQYIEEIAIAAGCYKIILDCGENNIEFYNKCGYHKHESMMRKDLCITTAS